MFWVQFLMNDGVGQKHVKEENTVKRFQEKQQNNNKQTKQTKPQPTKKTPKQSIITKNQPQARKRRVRESQQSRTSHWWGQFRLGSMAGKG